MNKKRYLSITLCIILICSLFLASCTAYGTDSKLILPENQNDLSQITVAIYPYIPDVELFENLLSEHWAKIEPDIKLNFVNWDCYLSDDPSKIDVIMYDALFTTFLAENNFIQPIDSTVVEDMEGILPFAVEGAYHDEKLYGIPNLICSYFLIHYKNDSEVAAVKNIDELYAVLEDRKTSSAKPKDNTEGLVLSFADNYPYYYLDALIDKEGEYTTFDEAPDCTAPDPEIIDMLHDMIAMAGKKQAFQSKLSLWLNGSFQKAGWFGEGHGRAYYGYSEDMAFMEEIIDEIDLKTISFSEKENTQMFFADIVSLSTGVTNEEKIEKCLQLMNLMASEEFLTALATGKENAQYLLPARASVYPVVAEKYPMYEKLHELVADENNRISRFGSDVYLYLNDAYGIIEN